MDTNKHEFGGTEHDHGLPAFVRQPPDYGGQARMARISGNSENDEIRIMNSRYRVLGSTPKAFGVAFGSLAECPAELSSGPRHCGRDCEKRNDREVFSTVLFVGDKQRRFPGRKAHKIPVGHFEQSSRSRFDLERLVFCNQLFQQRCVHLIQRTLNPESAFVKVTSKGFVHRGGQAERPDATSGHD